jgi:hypothetical protein
MPDPSRFVGFLLFQVVLFGCSASSELTLIPDGYEGPVLIFFNANDGQPPEFRGKARVYRISRSGVLRTQFPTPSGYAFPTFYYARGDTLIRRIRDLDGPEMSSADTSVYVFLVATGTLGKSPGENMLRDRYYLSFLVGHVSDAESLATRGERLLDEYWLQKHDTKTER